MSSLVHYERREGVSIITLDDGKVNALSPAMWSDINTALDQAEDDGTVVILTGRDGIFSAGFDLKVLRGDPSEADALLEAGFRTAERVLSFRSPVIAAVSGHAIAMGSFLVMSCDYRIGVDGPFRLVANEVAIGMTMPYGIVELCRQRLAPAQLSRALSLAEPFEGAAAVRAGFLDEVVDAGDVLTRALDKAAEYVVLDRSAYYGSKLRIRAAGLTAIRAGFERDALERAQYLR
jgi:enoyl-CoA hydratase